MKLFPVRLLLVVSIFSFITDNFYSQSSCDADHMVLLINYEFSPSELTIAPGETVAFINVEGTHDVNGITNSITGEPFNNPEDFYLNETIGTTSGVCMGLSLSISQAYTTMIVALVFMPIWEWLAPLPWMDSASQT